MFRRLYSMKVLSDQFRQSMSRVSQQAMILTSGTPHATPINQLHGMTLGSVCSLSIYPKPVLQFNLHLPSYTSRELHSCRICAIHILPPSAESVHLLRIFAKGVKQDNQKELVLGTSKEEIRDGRIFHEMTRPFEKLEQNEFRYHDVDDVKVPILNEAEIVFICKARENFKVDSHEIWVVDVVDILRGGDEKSGGGGGVLYYNRGFHSVGESLKEIS
ncbi:uncharacterized protein SPAPADRAFT_137703 [Spathaspora passalidarum NRRL Y-27907]|uniref:Flavin reductase like domain-containing protein n=1 Tax=Spathaspora passalidarum (strain NRRL Y-27907 / 11-Y1) TaxID=619300 RepID=G3AKA3_SPAPN|nr:uncharacterized protein SPAPADRAFT_137703 [Spathaspora passalidarum NRRL Y-27907]EGW33563.1 hypothetical protein SPAPADRAFT_137703 [Spathaspora passalidarum NRRL Y-27907]